MQVIVLENEPSSSRGGQELSLLDVCRGLSQRGHSISLIYTKEGDLLKQYQEFCTFTAQVQSLAIYRRSQLIRFLLDVGAVAWKSHNWKAKNNPALVYSNQYQDSFFAAALARTKNIPFVCHLRIPPPQPSRWQWDVGIKAAQHFVAVSHQTKQEWINQGIATEKIEIVHNGISPDLFQPNADLSRVRQPYHLSLDNYVVAYVGRLDREKGLEILLKAIALLQERTSIKLLIAGRPLMQNRDYQRSLEQLATELGITQAVTFLGHVAHSTSVYQASDVTVLPSLWSEPFGRAIIESMACGTPVIASRTGGIPEILTGDFQNDLFTPGDVQGLAQRLKQRLDWRTQEPELGQRCRQHILNNFSVSSMVNGVEQVMSKVSKLQSSKAP